MAKKRLELESHVAGQANKPLSKLPHALTHEAVVAEVEANVHDGLTSTEAGSRLQEYGPNELDDGPGVQPAKILVRQIANAMILVKRTAVPVSIGLLLIHPSGPYLGHVREFRDHVLY